MTWHLDTAAVCALVGLLTGFLVPALIARLPEPAPEEAGAEASGTPTAVPSTVAGAAAGPDPVTTREVPGPAEPAEPHRTTEPPEPHRTTEPPEPHRATEPPVAEEKELYVDIARRPGLRATAAVATAVTAGLLGFRLGWTPALSIALYLAPVGVALSVVDWRTRLLPTRIVAPSYGVVVVLALGCALVSGDGHALVTAAIGWLAAGGTFFVLWFVYPRGMGYGDVRLAGLLGIALGYLGWFEMLSGVYAGFLLGGVGGLLLSLVRVVDRKAYPFGPFMLVGAVVGVLVAPYVAALYA